jgi:hypothetical protein
MPCGKTPMYKHMIKEYGKKKGKRIYYATKKKRG